MPEDEKCVKGESIDMEYRLKTGKTGEKVVSGYKKIEDGVVGTYKKIEGGVVGTYKKIETAFVDRFLEEVPDKDKPDEK